MNGCRARKAALAPVGSLPHAHQSDHVRIVAMESDLGVRLVEPRRAVEGTVTNLAYMAEQVAAWVLSTWPAEVEAEAPGRQFGSLVAPPMYGETAHEDQSPTMLEFVVPTAHSNSEGTKWDVASGEFTRRHPERRDVVERSFDVVDLVL
jgi:hypothetical protein